MGNSIQSAVALAGRILLSLIFLASGSMKILAWTKTAEHMTSEGMAAVPFFLFMAILVELAGGLSLLLGCKARTGALLLASFLIPVTLIFHDFWTYSGLAQENQMQHFMKNLTIIGGLLTIAAHGAGRWSFDARRTPSAAAYDNDADHPRNSPARLANVEAKSYGPYRG